MEHLLESFRLHWKKYLVTSSKNVLWNVTIKTLKTESTFSWPSCRGVWQEWGDRCAQRVRGCLGAGGVEVMAENGCQIDTQPDQEEPVPRLKWRANGELLSSSLRTNCRKMRSEVRAHGEAASSPGSVPGHPPLGACGGEAWRISERNQVWF